jgi:CRP-like cAMP-binding protein
MLAGRIGAGEVLGEMSLLTGAARSADVVALVDTTACEVSRAALAPILRRRPDLVARIGAIVAARDARNAALADAAPAGAPARAPAESAALLARMRGFFGLD